jgi:hypothetical protein
MPGPLHWRCLDEKFCRYRIHNTDIDRFEIAASKLKNPHLVSSLFQTIGGLRIHFLVNKNTGEATSQSVDVSEALSLL